MTDKIKLTECALNNRQFTGSAAAALPRAQQIWAAASPAERLDIINFLEEQMQQIGHLANGEVLVAMSPQEWQSIHSTNGNANGNGHLPLQKSLPQTRQTRQRLRQMCTTGRLSNRVGNAVLRWLTDDRIRREPELAPLLDVDNFQEYLRHCRVLPFSGGGPVALRELREAFLSTQTLFLKQSTEAEASNG